MIVPSGRIVLLTGATGFVGKVVLEEIVRRREELGVERVLALVRASDPEHADARLRADVLTSKGFAAHAPGWEKRVEAIAGDLVKPGLGLSGEARARIAREVTHVIHCAASVEFDLPLAEATAVNTTGALHALEVARACGRLESLVSVSTAYVKAHPRPVAGNVARAREELAPLPRPAQQIYDDIVAGRAREEALLAETGHPNTYTLTKCLAEHLVTQRGAGLPLTLVRPSIVSASLARPAPGWIDSAAAFAGFVAMIGTGKLRVVAGDPRAKLDVVPCDAVAHRVVEAAFSPPDKGSLRIQHVVAGMAGALPIPLCRERIVGFFQRNPVNGDRAHLAFVGRRGHRFHIAQSLFHAMPVLGSALVLAVRGEPNKARAAFRLLNRQRATNRDFAYFTHATFDFETSVPLDPPLDPAGYLDVVCDGVSRNLLRRERRRRGAA
jgi:thioester reductase-like protein